MSKRWPGATESNDDGFEYSVTLDVLAEDKRRALRGLIGVVAVLSLLSIPAFWPAHPGPKPNSDALYVEWCGGYTPTECREKSWRLTGIYELFEESRFREWDRASAAWNLEQETRPWRWGSAIGFSLLMLGLRRRIWRQTEPIPIRLTASHLQIGEERWPTSSIGSCDGLGEYRPRLQILFNDGSLYRTPRLWAHEDDIVEVAAAIERACPDDGEHSDPETAERVHRQLDALRHRASSAQ